MCPILGYLGRGGGKGDAQFLVNRFGIFLTLPHPIGILLVNASQYLPDGFVCWMLLGKSIGNPIGWAVFYFKKLMVVWGKGKGMLN